MMTTWAPTYQSCVHLHSIYMYSSMNQEISKLEYLHGSYFSISPLTRNLACFICMLLIIVRFKI